MKLRKILEDVTGYPQNHKEDDHEAEMALTDLRSIVHRASELVKRLEEDNVQELEGWIQAKITKSADYINAVYDSFMFEDDDSYHDDDCDTCGDMKEAMEPKSAYGDQVYSNIETLKSAATKIMFKPENYSVLTDGNKFMLTTNRRAGIFAKEGNWKIIGKIDPNKTYRELDSNLFEATSTCCGRCGHKHVKGTSCPKPFLTGKRHCRNRNK
jgi:hypothetical protein